MALFCALGGEVCDNAACAKASLSLMAIAAASNPKLALEPKPDDKPPDGIYCVEVGGKTHWSAWLHVIFIGQNAALPHK